MARGRRQYGGWEPGLTKVEDTPEARLLALVRELCERLGVLVYHTHDSRRSEPGFPDLVIVGAGGVLFRELKSATGRVTAEQQMWLNLLNLAGQDADVWRPADFTSLRIANELKAIRHLKG